MKCIWYSWLILHLMISLINMCTFLKKVITFQRQRNIPFVWGLRCLQLINTFLAACCRVLLQTLQSPVTQIWCSYQKTFCHRQKNCQSLSQQWSWFTWTLALRKKLIWSCLVLFNLDINLCLSSFDKVNSTVIVVKGNLLLGELNAFWWNFEEQAKISNRIVVEVYKVWILT